MCRVLLDLKSAVASGRLVVCCKHAGSNEVPTGVLSYPPHRCRTDALHARSSQVLTGVLGVLTAPMGYPNQSPLSPCSSCTRCCVTRPLPRGCCACRAHVRNDQEYRPKYETRNEREYPNRNPSPLEARRMAAAPMALSIFARRTRRARCACRYIYI